MANHTRDHTHLKIAIAIIIALIAITAAVAEAKSDRKRRKSPELTPPHIELPHTPPDPTTLDPRATLAATALTGATLLTTGLILARAARNPRQPRLTPYAQGRARSRRAHPETPEAAIHFLTHARLGTLQAQLHPPGAATITLTRRRGTPCHLAQGAIAGAFESAWGRTTTITHETCPGKARGPCVYEVRVGGGSGAATW